MNIFRPFKFYIQRNSWCQIRCMSKKLSGNSDSKSSNDKKSENKLEKFDKNVKISGKEKKLESLTTQAKNFKSIGPNEKNSINKTIAKPKIHVRQSARPKEDLQLKEEVEPIDILTRGLDKRLVEAARRVANRMPKHLAKQTEKQLLDSIQKQKEESSKAAEKFAAPKENITESISYKILSSKIEKGEKTSKFDVGATSTLTKIKIPIRPSSSHQTQMARTVGFFTGECLSIFDPKGIYVTDLVNRNLLWEKLSQKELELSLKTPPKNYYEEMILLTEEGKLWKFPINNEQGLEHEENVPFYEHVLLDNLLTDFPQQGPVRQFMELVIMGLSQNPYVSVERKHETIKFYKNFFSERNLMNEIEVEEN